VEFNKIKNLNCWPEFSEIIGTGVTQANFVRGLKTVALTVGERIRIKTRNKFCIINQ